MRLAIPTLLVMLALSAGLACGSDPVASPPPGPLDPKNRDSATLRLELMVDDVQRSVTFYTGVLGFVLQSSEPTYAVVRAGGVTFGLNAVSDLSSSHPFRPEITTQRHGLGTEIVIEVADVGNYYAAVQASGWAVSSPLQKRSWGLTDFRVIDPDGYYLRITSR